MRKNMFIEVLKQLGLDTFLLKKENEIFMGFVYEVCKTFKFH